MDKYLDINCIYELQNNNKKIDLFWSFFYDIEKLKKEKGKNPTLAGTVLPHWFTPEDKSTLYL